MDDVYENNVEQLHDIGMCTAHNRIFECYCTACNIIICPSCLMFDEHKGHPVAKIDQGSKSLRQRITQCSKQGLLKFQKTQNFLLDIRHAKLTVQQNKISIIQEVQNSFDKLISMLKQRKSQCVQQLKQHYDKQIQTLQQKQSIWLDKQQKAQKVLEYQKSNDQLKLIQNAQFIVQSLQLLRTPPQKQLIKLVDKPKTTITVGNQVVSLDELVEILRNYLGWQISSVNQIKA